MGEKTEISWADSTFNPWIGCMKVSAGCDNCYAETMMDKRYHRVQWGQRKILGVEGSVGTRQRTSASNWRNPIIWNERAAGFKMTFGRRRRVFCSSLADVFDNQVPSEWRTDLWAMIEATPYLDWLLLTKRPENIRKLIDPLWLEQPQANVWLGTTCEDQAAYDKRWPILREIPAAVRFISYEPAIGPLDIRSGLRCAGCPGCCTYDCGNHGLSWLICGGESGKGYRDMEPQWAFNAMKQCEYAGVAFFMKQMAGRAAIPDLLMTREFPVAA